MFSMLMFSARRTVATVPWPVSLFRWSQHLASALGVTMALVMCTPISFWWATFLAGPWNDPSGDVLIVLTGSVVDDQTVGISSYWRAVYAAHLFQREQFRELIVTGGPAETSSMRTFMVALGVPVASIRLEPASLSTRESAVNMAALLAADVERYHRSRLVLLTSDYHMSRSWLAFRHAGILTLPRPIPDARKRAHRVLERWQVFTELVLETTKLAYYWVRGWLDTANAAMVGSVRRREAEEPTDTWTASIPNARPYRSARLTVSVRRTLFGGTPRSREGTGEAPRRPRLVRRPFAQPCGVSWSRRYGWMESRRSASFRHAHLADVLADARDASLDRCRARVAPRAAPGPHPPIKLQRPRVSDQRVHNLPPDQASEVPYEA